MCFYVAEVFHVLEDKNTVPDVEKEPDVYLASEIIRDFMQFLNLDNSHSVFMEEIGQPPEVRVDRQFIASEIGFQTPEGDRTPLLLHLIQQLKKINKQGGINDDSSLHVELDT